MKTIKKHFDNLCLRLDRNWRGIARYGLGVLVLMVVAMIAGPLLPASWGVSFLGSANLIEGAAAIMVMTPMLMAIHGDALRERTERISWQNRDIDKWAKELVSSKPQAGLDQLQKTLDLRNMQTKCEELEDGLEPEFLDMLDDEWSPKEIDAVQRALDEHNFGLDL